GVVSIFYDKDGNEISRSPATYCSTCAVVVNAARTDFLAERIREALKDARSTGKLKYEQARLKTLMKCEAEALELQ
ncbi:MAG: hypothetical protein DRN91_06505, partial [Candidatus Alkanophagales archaeon]